MHEKATRLSRPQARQCTRAKPWARTPHSRKRRSSRWTKRGREAPGRASSSLLTTGLFVSAFTEQIRTPVHAALSPDFYALEVSEDVRFLERLNRVLPKDAVISADHISRAYLVEDQPEIYMYPNPFSPAYFGIEGTGVAKLKHPPEVDIVVWKAGQLPIPGGLAKREGRLEAVQAVEETLDSEFELVSEEGDRFHVWLGRSFARRPEAEEVRQLLRSFRR